VNFKRVLNNAGLTKIELAALYGVSRQTVHTWAAGGLPRAGSYTERMATVITRALNAALDKRMLPFGPMDRTVRVARIAKMAITLQNLKPAPKS